VSWLHDPRLRAEPLLDIALGLRSTIARLDALLDRYAANGATDENVNVNVNVNVNGDELTLVVLGAIALRDRLDRELARAVARAALPVDDVPIDRPDEGLLR
jgi:hypothetical protein